MGEIRTEEQSFHQNDKECQPTPNAGRDFDEDIHHRTTAFHCADSKIEVVGGIARLGSGNQLGQREVEHQREGNENTHKAGCVDDTLHFRSKTVDKGHIEYGNGGQDMLDPVLIISIISRACGRDYRRSEQGEKPQRAANEEAHGIDEPALCEHHNRRQNARPTANLDLKFIQHIMLGRVARADVHKTPVIGHFAYDHNDGEDITKFFFVFPSLDFFTEVKNEKNADGEKNNGDKVRERPVCKIPFCAVTKETFAEKVSPNLTFHKFLSPMHVDFGRYFLPPHYYSTMK